MRENLRRVFIGGCRVMGEEAGGLLQKISVLPALDKEQGRVYILQ